MAIVSHKALTRFFGLLLSCSWLVACQDAPTTIRIPYKQVQKIVVEDRGNFSTYPYRVLLNRDSIQQVCALLEKTKLVRTDTIIVKQTEHAATLHIYKFDGEDIAIFFGVTFSNGTIFDYKGSRYQEYKIYDYLK